MTSAHFVGSATTCRAAARATTAARRRAASGAAISPSRRALHAPGGVVGFVLLVPRPNALLREGRQRPGGEGARPAHGPAGYLTDTQCGEFTGQASRGTGDIVFESQSPARIQVSVAVNPRGRRPNGAGPDEHLDDPLPAIRRFPPVTLVAREFRLSPEEDGAGVLAGTLECRGVRQAVNIPIVFTIHGTLLQGQGHVIIDLTDLGTTPPGRRGLEVQNDIAIEVCLLVASR